MPILDVKGLRKSYGDITAVNDISFSVGRGEIVGLLGPNGAGKTTTISMVLGILEPSAGSVALGGIDLSKRHDAFMAKTNFAAAYAQLPGNLTVAQNLTVFGMLYDVRDLSSRLEELLREFDLVQFRDTKTGLLSSGEQMRVQLAKSFLNAPELLLLDEPTSSLDPSTAHTVREHIQAYAAEGNSGVLWTSHNMHEVADVCDRVLFLSKGKILLEGDPKKLPQEHGKKDLEELFIAVAREPLSLSQEP